MIEPGKLQRQERLAREPVSINPQTKVKYVLVRQKVYERLKNLIVMDEFDADAGAGFFSVRF